ncbi:hypothetical protein [Microbacterium sp. 77mftsu3.1]|uniref:hypothetical protein n=1 Tax=Microbacterium sp. 77mftsu3.1 TaxID=1761802 RepID=UPI000377C789|nr:hypothetical protein [Microbacterium sp. 77mftsu3.1]SDG56407.1 hypothetical protein SAMN04488590_1116 [Microbacterium sp. 77mftsu3.1]
MTTIDDTPWRRALRAYPSSWRERHGEAILGTLLDEAEAQGRDEPSRGERIALMRSGLAVRILGWMPHPAREALATASAATGFALAVMFAVFSGFGERVDWRLPAEGQNLDLQASPGLVPAGLWVIAFVLILCGAARAARIALAATAVAGVGAFVYAQLDPLAGPRAITTVTMTDFALLAILTPVRARLAAAATAAMTTGILVFFHLFFEVPPGSPSDAIWLRVLTEEFTGFLAGAVWVLALLAAIVRARAVARCIGAAATVWTIVWLIRLTMWDVVTGMLGLAAVLAVVAIGAGIFRAGARWGRGTHPREGAA